MRYEILETDVGQGAGAIAVPVTYGKPVERTDICQPYSVAEVLQTVFHADFQTVFGKLRADGDRADPRGRSVAGDGADESSAVVILENIFKVAAANRPDCGRCDTEE